MRLRKFEHQCITRSSCICRFILIDIILLITEKTISVFSAFLFVWCPSCLHFVCWSYGLHNDYQTHSCKEYWSPRDSLGMNMNILVSRIWYFAALYPFITLNGLTHLEKIIFASERNIGHIQTTFKDLHPTAQGISYLTVKYQIVNDAYGNNRYLLWEFYDTHKCTEWASNY